VVADPRARAARRRRSSQAARDVPGDRSPAKSDPRFVTAIVVATGLGVVLFAPFLRAAAGMRKDEWDRYEAALPAILAELLRAPPLA
jgi:hypothetical protein